MPIERTTVALADRAGRVSAESIVDFP